MTTQEQSLHDDKMRAEIAHMSAGIAHLNMQTIRIQQQMRWQMPIYLVSFIGVILAGLKFL